MIKKSIPHSLGYCYFVFFLVHTIVEVIFTIVKYGIGFSKLTEFVLLMIIYTFMDGYFSWVILSYAAHDYDVNQKELRDFKIPGVRTHNPYMGKEIEIYIPDQSDYKHVPKGSLQANRN